MAADKNLKWAKEKAKEGYEAAQDKAGQSVESAKETLSSNAEAAKQKSQNVKDSLAGRLGEEL